MIIHHLTKENVSPLVLKQSWVVDTDSLALARITLSRDLLLNVEMIKPPDLDAPFFSDSFESFSPSPTAARILKDLRVNVHTGIKLHTVTMIEQGDLGVPEYLDFYELDGDGIFIMRMSEPVFVAEYDGRDWINVGSFRFRTDLSCEGWAYYITEAYEELESLNALQEK